MKTLEQILETSAIYLKGFESIIDVIGDFENIYISTKEYNNPLNKWEIDSKAQIDNLLSTKYKDVNIILASYETPSYEGYAYVLFEKNGKLYEVDAGHCSCYGLEGQWNPTEVDIKELEHRLLEGSFGESSYSGYFKKELCEKLGVEYKSNQDKYSW